MQELAERAIRAAQDALKEPKLYTFAINADVQLIRSKIPDMVEEDAERADRTIDRLLTTGRNYG